MTKNKFLMVSLKDDKAKHLAEVLSNKTSREILDFLADKEATESEIAKKLNLPLSTTHYNLQKLIKSKLVKSKKFHYSEKGKEVHHYKLSNQHIVISPENTPGIKDKLKEILPVGLISFAGAGAIYFYQKFSTVTTGFAEETQKDIMPPLGEAADEAVQEVPNLVNDIIQSDPNYALWFLIGSLFVIITTLILNSWRKSKWRN